MLTDQEVMPLNWQGDFKYPNMVRIRTIADGSCYFHAIIKAIFKPYVVGYLDGQPLNRYEFIKELRKDLADHLDYHYDNLARGSFKKDSEHMKELSLESMKNILKSNTEPVNELFDEYISNILDKDIYVLDAKTQDVYMHPDRNSGLLYKNRKSVVILDLHGHYELVGLSNSGVIRTHFMPNDPFILYIKRRLGI